MKSYYFLKIAIPEEIVYGDNLGFNNYAYYSSKNFNNKKSNSNPSTSFFQKFVVYFSFTIKGIII